MASSPTTLHRAAPSEAGRIAGIVVLAPTWHNLAAIARRNIDATLASVCIERVRAEAEELASHRYSDWRVNKAIADAAQGFIDCPCVDCLDEIDALLADEGPDELREARPEFLSPAVFGAFR